MGLIVFLIVLVLLSEGAVSILVLHTITMVVV